MSKTNVEAEGVRILLETIELRLDHKLAKDLADGQTIADITQQNTKLNRCLKEVAHVKNEIVAASHEILSIKEQYKIPLNDLEAQLETLKGKLSQHEGDVKQWKQKVRPDFEADERVRDYDRIIEIQDDNLAAEELDKLEQKNKPTKQSTEAKTKNEKSRLLAHQKGEIEEIKKEEYSRPASHWRGRMNFSQTHAFNYLINTKTELVLQNPDNCKNFTNAEAFKFWMNRLWQAEKDVVTLPLTLLTVAAFVFFIACTAMEERLD